MIVQVGSLLCQSLVCPVQTRLYVCGVLYLECSCAWQRYSLLHPKSIYQDKSLRVAMGGSVVKVLTKTLVRFPMYTAWSSFTSPSLYSWNIVTSGLKTNSYAHLWMATAITQCSWAQRDLPINKPIREANFTKKTRKKKHVTRKTKCQVIHFTCLYVYNSWCVLRVYRTCVCVYVRHGANIRCFFTFWYTFNLEAIKQI